MECSKVAPAALTPGTQGDSTSFDIRRVVGRGACYGKIPALAVLMELRSRAVLGSHGPPVRACSCSMRAGMDPVSGKDTKRHAAEIPNCRSLIYGIRRRHSVLVAKTGACRHVKKAWAMLYRNRTAKSMSARSKQNWHERARLPMVYAAIGERHARWPRRLFDVPCKTGSENHEGNLRIILPTPMHHKGSWTAPPLARRVGPCIRGDSGDPAVRRKRRLIGGSPVAKTPAKNVDFS